jgi:hypothetical protein
MLLIKTKLKSSSIEGIGVFAEEFMGCAVRKPVYLLIIDL